MNTDDIKTHYNSAAQNRDTRLKSQSGNVAQFNHRIRERVIARFLKRFAPYSEGIDIGTGTGVWAEILARMTSKVLGVDFAEENIRIASINAEHLGLNERVSYALGNAQTLEHIPSGRHDVAIQISVLQHLPDKAGSIARIEEILSPGGVLVMLVHNRKCVYNRNLRLQQKREKRLSVNEYVSLPELLALVRGVGLEVVEVRHCWLFVNDLVYLGASWPLLRPLAPVRRVAVELLALLDQMLGGSYVLSPLFREIVILARKPD